MLEKSDSQGYNVPCEVVGSPVNERDFDNLGNKIEHTCYNCLRCKKDREEILINKLIIENYANIGSLILKKLQENELNQENIDRIRSSFVNILLAI